MAIPAAELAKLEQDFLSGRNPMAYLPLCQALRRDRRYTQALEVCQRGLSKDANSIAGRTLLARLLTDLGRYDDAMHEISRTEKSAPDSMGLLIEKARCQIKLRQLREADDTMARLNTINPMDPQVQVLNGQLRALHRQEDLRSGDMVPVAGAVSSPLTDVLGKLRGQLEPLGKVVTLALLDLDSGKTYVDGIPHIAEAAEQLYQEVTLAADELDQGLVRSAILELGKVQCMVMRRDRRLLILGVDPAMNYGKLLHRVKAVLDQLLPLAPRPEADGDDE